MCLLGAEVWFFEFSRHKARKVGCGDHLILGLAIIYKQHNLLTLRPRLLLTRT